MIGFRSIRIAEYGGKIGQWASVGGGGEERCSGEQTITKDLIKPLRPMGRSFDYSPNPIQPPYALWQPLTINLGTVSCLWIKETPFHTKHCMLVAPFTPNPPLQEIVRQWHIPPKLEEGKNKLLNTFLSRAEDTRELSGRGHLSNSKQDL
jgi:hypothetical protein